MDEREQEREIAEAGARYREQLAHLHRRDNRETVEQTEENILTREELELLWQCEDEIRHGLQAFLAVAEALHTIQQQRLYREDYPNFTAYCRDKWNLTDRHARNLANAWGVAQTLQSADELPRNERQFRELSPVPEDRRMEVWEHALGIAGGVENVCAHHIKEARQTLIDGPEEEMRREAERLDEQPEEESDPEPIMAPARESVVIDQDPANHARRIFNKYGAVYAQEVVHELCNLLMIKESSED